MFSKTKIFITLIIALLSYVAAFGSTENGVFNQEELSCSYSIYDVDNPPVPIRQLPPQIPDRLLAGHDRICVVVIINESGRIGSVRCLRCDDDNVKKLVKKAIRQWRFQAAEKGGQNVAVRIVMPIRLKYA